jgi:predicted phage-related endonuclease
LTAISALSHYVTPETGRVKGEIPDGMQEAAEELMMIKQRLNEITEREKELKKQVLTAMQNAGEDTWGNDLIQFSRTKAYEREGIDTKALKEKMPEVYESFKKMTKVSESISYKLL